MRFTVNKVIIRLLPMLLLAYPGTLCTFGQDAGFKVSGHVYAAETGLPLEDIGISAANASLEPVSTGADGQYEITLPDANEQLVVSYPGFKEKVVFVHGRKEIDIWLLGEDDLSVSDKTGMLFREVPLRNVTGAVETSRLSELSHSPHPSFDQDLQGMMSGLTAISRSGMPGEGAYFSCRGFSSLYSSSIPLVVIDGMILKSGSFENPIIHGFHYNPLADLDKRDISGMTLLKDAVETGPYGIKASDGVLLITTIPPRGGKTTLDVSVSGGISFAPAQIPVMDATHYSSYVMEQMYDAGMTSAEIFSAYPFMEFSEDYLYASRYNNKTNWQDEVFQNGNLYDAHLTVRGGDARARYSLSGGYLSNEAIVRNASYNRFNFRFNSVVQVSSKLDIGFNLGYTNGRYNLMETGAVPHTNPMLASLIKSPLLAVNQKDREGISLPIYDDVADFGLSNPAVIVNEVEASDGTSKFLGVSYVNLKISDKLSARAQFGLDRLKSNEKIFIPSWGMAPQGDGSAERSMQVKVDQYNSILGETRISYLNRFGYIHDLALDAGARYMISRLSQDAGSAQNSATDEFKDLNSGKADEKSVSGFEDRWSWINYFLSAKYILNDRYIIQANLCLDASSKFGNEVEEGIALAGYPFAVLPSVGVAWRVSSESFIPDMAYLDELKLRASYGLTGSDNFTSYYTRLYYSSIPYYSITGFTLDGLYNPGLKWEDLRTANMGLDLAMLHERLILNADWYNITTKDMITYLKLPAYYGYETYLSNGGSCRNRGFEINLYGKILNSSLQWEMDANITHYENEVVSLEKDQIITSFTGGEKISMIGQPMGLFYGYRFLGVFSSQQEANAAGLVDKAGRRFNAGDVHFADLDENGIIDEQDRTVIGNPHPDLTAGLFNRISYRGISLSFLIYWNRGADVFNYIRSEMESMKGFDNQTTAVYNRWVAEGQETDIPRADFGDPMGNNRFSSRWIEDGSYIRLRNVTLSYTFTRNLAFINNLNIYLTGTNLITSTSYLGYDPEFNFQDGVPGLGIDYGKIPQARSLVVGLKIGL